MKGSKAGSAERKRKKFFTIQSTAKYLFLTWFILCFKINNDGKILYYVVNTHQQEIKLYYKNKNGQPYGSIQMLKNDVDRQNKKLIFAMNGGMYQQDNSPLGLYIENKKLITPLNTKTGSGNFHLKPNGVFYISNNNTAHVCTTENFKNKNVKYATQSGPMLIIDGKIHHAFKEGSHNINIRNGVGIINDSTVVFGISKEEISFYDFAKFFQSRRRVFYQRQYQCTCLTNVCFFALK
jgi:uncharacterized protein YigE (DUF2233 family)